MAMKHKNTTVQSTSPLAGAAAGSPMEIRVATKGRALVFSSPQALVNSWLRGNLDNALRVAFIRRAKELGIELPDRRLGQAQARQGNRNAFKDGATATFLTPTEFQKLSVGEANPRISLIPDYVLGHHETLIINPNTRVIKGYVEKQGEYYIIRGFNIGGSKCEDCQVISGAKPIGEMGMVEGLGRVKVAIGQAKIGYPIVSGGQVTFLPIKDMIGIYENVSRLERCLPHANGFAEYLTYNYLFNELSKLAMGYSTMPVKQQTIAREVWQSRKEGIHRLSYGSTERAIVERMRLARQQRKQVAKLRSIFYGVSWEKLALDVVKFVSDSPPSKG